MYCKQISLWVGQKTAHVGAYWVNELFPIVCGICGKVGVELCDACGAALSASWQQTTHPLLPDKPVFYLKKYTHSRYRQLIAALKYRGRPDVIEKVINRVCGYLPLTEESVLVPVPMSRSRFAVRGYNQCDFVAAALSARYGGVHKHIVRRRAVWGSAHAVGANREHRLQKHPMRARASVLPAGASVWVVDDVLTTGGTSRDVVQALQEARYSVAGVIVLAVTPRRQDLHPP